MNQIKAEITDYEIDVNKEMTDRDNSQR